jgi:hypothetical protein|nr:MAG TPA: ASCH domain protein [Caudoviricetes sp.]
MKKIMFNDKFLLTKAVLDGQKTMTRRVIKCPRAFKGEWVGGFNVHIRPSDKKIIGYPCMYDADEREFDGGEILPKYKVGEVVAIAMSYEHIFYELHIGLPIDDDPSLSGIGFKNKMFVKPELMPYAIKITDIRVERLQDISNQDCLQEGIKKHISHAKVYYTHDGIGNYFFDTPRDAFVSLIDRVSGKGTWESNPFVWVYSFEVIENPRS